MVYNQDTYEPLAFDAIRIGLASPDKILKWSHGEVTKPETINYRTLKPEKDGLYCERIFGPTKDWECHCGKVKKIRNKGTICDRCGVEVTKSSVRRERMGHIKLAAPVSHIWYFKGIPSRMGLILDMSPKALEKVLYFASYVVLDPGDTDLSYKQVLSEKEYREALSAFGSGTFRAGMGAESVLELLKAVDLEQEASELREELKTASSQRKPRVLKRIEVIDAFRNSGNKPEWMVLTVLPVIPPEIRPMVQLDGGRFATSDLNDFYRRIINRNNRLARLIDLGAPEIIVRNEKRMLQEAVDALIDNGRRGRAVTGPGNRSLKSLSDMLKGKQGRFRQNLLGKRVDYSGRSVIVVGPELKIYQCGLPKEMAIELFKPFVMKELAERGSAHNIKAAKKMVERLEPEVWDVLEQVIKEHPVMLNRAPTLHRLGIQAFEPILVEGKAIRLHPLVCTAFNADFDGDQMAVHLPISLEAQAECRFMLLSPNNLLKPSDGGVVSVPSQDMVLGIYYLTQMRPGEKGEGSIYKSPNEAILAYDNKTVGLHAAIRVRMKKTMEDGRECSGIFETTVGRIIFNEVIPQDIGYVDRTVPGNEARPEIDFLVKKDKLKEILERVMTLHGSTVTAVTLDSIKDIGYKYSTQAAMSVSIEDMVVPSEKKKIIAETEEVVDQINENFMNGELTEEKRHEEVISAWQQADGLISVKLMEGLGEYNSLNMMADSGARGSEKQIKQLAGMRGLMGDTTGHTIELPIKSNFREGLDILEYFISAHGARKGLSDTALRTADSGYLTRRLVDVTQDIIIRQEDCSSGRDEIPYIEISDFAAEQDEGSGELNETLADRLSGRYIAETVVDPDTGETIIEANELCTDALTKRVVDALKRADRPTVKIRSVLSCRCKNGVCSKCYGINLATRMPVNVGEAVGIIAAQSIGEPGTQLTMRNFHTGGVESGQDITRGLPRVEELFEARKPKGVAIISEIAGTVSFRETKKKHEVVVTNDETGESCTYLIPFGSYIKVSEGEVIEAGQEITEGSVNPHDILRIKGVKAVRDYMIKETQKVYRLQGVDINDKHIEMIVRQMMKRTRVEDPGDSDFLPGAVVNLLDFDEVNEELVKQGKTPATGSIIMLGITKAALATDSFLSAASFQETTKVLTEAAINGRVDHLRGLKENVLIGKLIPAGTGMKEYNNLKLSAARIPVTKAALYEEYEDEAFAPEEELSGTGEEVFAIEPELTAPAPEADE